MTWTQAMAGDSQVPVPGQLREVGLSGAGREVGFRLS